MTDQTTLAALLLKVDGEAGGNRRLTQGWAEDIAARLHAAGVRVPGEAGLRAPYIYSGQHDDCIATIAHYHDEPYQPGQWSAALNGVTGDAGLDVERLARAIDTLPPSFAQWHAGLKEPQRIDVGYRPSATNVLQIIAAAQAAGLEVVDLTTEESDLEDAFVGSPARGSTSRAARPISCATS